MHLTQILYKHNYGRAIRAIWKRQGKMEIKPLEIPPELQAMGVKIYDALEVVKESYIKYGPKPTVEMPELFTLDTDSAGEKFYVFDNEVRVTEQEPQILALTKTLLFNGFPPVLNSLINSEEIANQDQLIQNCIVQAIAKDGEIVKLPKVTDDERPGWVFPRVYGVCYERKASLLLEKLSFLAQMGSGKFPESLSRGKIITPFCETVVDKAGDTVVYQLSCDALMTSEKPLKPFSSGEEVENTKDQELISIYPIKPTLDLWQCESNPIKHNKGYMFDVPNQHIHTLHVVHRTSEFWWPFQKLSRAIATCFAFSVKEARRLYGDDVKILPKPVCVQCTYSDIQNIGFLVYQLNTVELSDSSGIKNQVWVDGPHALYKEVNEMAEIINYNREIFPKMFALYLNGAHPDSV